MKTCAYFNIFSTDALTKQEAIELLRKGREGREQRGNIQGSFSHKSLISIASFKVYLITKFGLNIIYFITHEKGLSRAKMGLGSLFLFYSQELSAKNKSCMLVPRTCIVH